MSRLSYTPQSLSEAIEYFDNCSRISFDLASRSTTRDSKKYEDIGLVWQNAADILENLVEHLERERNRS